MGETIGVVVIVILAILLIVCLAVSNKRNHFIDEYGYNGTIDPDKADWEKIIYDGIEYAVAVERKMVMIGKRKVMAYITPFVSTAGSQIIREHREQIPKVIKKHLSNESYAEQIKQLRRNGLIVDMGPVIET